MKKPVDQYSDQEILTRLAFAERLTKMPDGSTRSLPAHLEAEKQELIAEQRKRRGPQVSRNITIEEI